MHLVKSTDKPIKECLASQHERWYYLQIMLAEIHNESHHKSYLPAGIYLLKVNNRHIRTRCEICWKLTIKTPERRPWSRSGVFIVNFQHISHHVLVFLLLTLNMQLSAGNATPIYCFAFYLMYFWIWKTLLSISVKAFTDDDYVFDQNITNSIQTFLNLKLL